MSFALSSPPKRVCILRLSAIGDVCHTVPVLRALQDAWPDSRFVWIIGKTEAALLEGLGGVEFITLDKSRGLSGYRDLRARLAGRSFDLLLHMHPSMRANMASLFVRAKLRLGFDRARARDAQWLFTNRRIEAGRRQHVMEGLLGFPRALGVRTPTPRWDIPVAPVDREFAGGWLGKDCPLLVISPCSSLRRRNYRDWPAERYAEMADFASQRFGARVVLTGGATPRELDYGRRILELSRQRPENLIGRTSLKQLLALLEAADAVVCPDSGPAHMATAVGTPVIGLYASSNPGRTGPYRSLDHVVNRYPDALKRFLHKDVDAVPWGRRVRDPGAMAMIGVGDVAARLDEVLGGAERDRCAESKREEDNGGPLTGTNPPDL